jgi:hypothetical protein
MNLSDLVPSLEICQQLQAAGFPQDTAMVWERSMIVKGHPTSVHVVGDNSALCIEDFFEDICAAPTAEEILKELAPCIERGGVSYYLEVQITPAWGWDVDWTDDDGTYLQPRGEEDCKQTVVEPAALAYLWWKKEVAG